MGGDPLKQQNTPQNKDLACRYIHDMILTWAIRNYTQTSSRQTIDFNRVGQGVGKTG
jgi:hypothetical protein